MMPVNGHALPHTPLAVDFWQVRKCPRARLFFLSHAHSDHTVGLSSTWSHRPIYCSPVSATLLKLKLQVKEQWLHPLELNEPHMLPLDDIGKERLTVTLMDANHCPGAVMFLFQGYFGSILYTGDFRYTPSILREPCLRNNTTIDVLYLDNTNCDPTRTLPSRKTATQQIKEIIRSRPNHNVVIGLYTLGKESLLVELAMEFKTWVEVSFERMETLRALELPDVFTTDRGAGRIRAVDQSEICSANLRRWTTDCPTVAILPTSRPIVSFHPNVHVVPYSDHSSYQELEDFVSALKPTSLVPIVGNCVPGTFSALLPNRKRQEILVPESVRNYMRQPVIQRPQPGYSSFPRRPMGPPPPRGVVFESPVKRSRLSVVVSGEAVDVGRDPPEEETDSDLNEEEADGVLIDLRRDLAPTRRKRNVCDLGLHIVRTIPPDMEMAESVPLSQLSQSNFDSVQIVANTAASLKPVIAFKAEGGADSDAVSSASAASRFSVHRAQQNNMSLFQIGSISGFHNSSKCLTEIQSNCVEETERSLLLLLPFTEEDVRRCGLLDRSLVNRFRLSPCNVA